MRVVRSISTRWRPASSSATAEPRPIETVLEIVLMPELPEVETVRRGLEPRLVGRTLERVEILDGRLDRLPTTPS